MSVIVTPDQAITVFNSTRLLLAAMDSARRADHPLRVLHERRNFMREARYLRRLGVTARSLRTLVNQVDGMAPEPEEASEADTTAADHIALDNALRSALGWDEIPGRLAELTQESSSPAYWRLTDGCHAIMFSPIRDAKSRGWMHVPTLSGVTDLAEAKKIIYATVCS